jgi:hypothetical protein
MCGWRQTSQTPERREGSVLRNRGLFYTVANFQRGVQLDGERAITDIASADFHHVSEAAVLDERATELLDVVGIEQQVEVTEVEAVASVGEGDTSLEQNRLDVRDVGNAIHDLELGASGHDALQFQPRGVIQRIAGIGRQT